MSYVWIITAGTIITGCLNSIFTKYQDMQCVLNCDTPENLEYFEQPVLQTLQMFIGESGCWIVLLLVASRFAQTYFKLSESEYTPITDVPTNPDLQVEDLELDDSLKTKQPLTFKTSFWLVLPLMCDISGTTMLNLGLLYTPVSVYQMMRSSVVMFVAMMSVLFLGRKINRAEWLYLTLVSLGVLIVGMSPTKPHVSASKETDVGQALLGASLILIAEVFIAVQFVVEEFILKKFYIVPLKTVLLEGTFGAILTTLVIILGVLMGKIDLPEMITQMFSNTAILVSSILIMLSIGSFNFFGISLTNHLSATARSTVDTTRTLLVWLVSILIGWETFNFMQLLGFGILVVGTLLFNGVIEMSMEWQKRLHLVS